MLKLFKTPTPTPTPTLTLPAQVKARVGAEAEAGAVEGEGKGTGTEKGKADPGEKARLAEANEALRRQEIALAVLEFLAECDFYDILLLLIPAVLLQRENRLAGIEDGLTELENELLLIKEPPGSPPKARLQTEPGSRPAISTFNFSSTSTSSKGVRVGETPGQLNVELAVLEFLAQCVASDILLLLLPAALSQRENRLAEITRELEDIEKQLAKLYKKQLDFLQAPGSTPAQAPASVQVQVQTQNFTRAGVGAKENQSQPDHQPEPEQEGVAA